LWHAAAREEGAAAGGWPGAAGGLTGAGATGLAGAGLTGAGAGCADAVEKSANDAAIIVTAN